MIRTLDEVAPFEQLALIDMSYSRFDTYLMCPAKYFYSYIEKLPRPFAPAAAMGNIIHGVLEEAEEDLQLTELLMLMEEQRAKYDPDRQIAPELIKHGFQILIDYVDRHRDERPEVLGRETEFRIVVGSALILGYIDRIERRRDGRVQVMDYKSGGWEDRTNPLNNLQLGLYAVVASRLWDSPGGVYSELYYLRSGNRKGHFFTPDDLVAVEARLTEVMDTILEDHFFHPTNNSRICQRLCDYGKSGACRIGHARVSGANF